MNYPRLVPLQAPHSNGLKFSKSHIEQILHSPTVVSTLFASPLHNHPQCFPSQFCNTFKFSESFSKEMEGSVMALSSSTPTRPPATPKPSASDENEHYYQQLGSPNLSNPKKSMKKHYMSPTISAACKAVSSRKNILGERNEVSESVFSNTHVEKATPLTPPVSKSLCDEQNVVSDDLSSRPYDPVTNYLSPRPQFLRYNPNRRRELILGLGNSNAEGIDGLNLSSSGSFESQKASDEEGGSVTTSSSSDKQEDEDVEEIDGEIKGGDAEIKGIESIDEVIEGGMK
ncbi:hypothetical protein RchiOBHm_Chr2g0140801 [Rosa chinensis]|uniref:Uncharacterized protein n=1 Tax=Rosa chinensis TaxID=74649 RepID=A0A2P6RXE3_ROSCH|nr:hypothetical protein RchiOBHm_Chr2g0140801 [Rosa chinensis]